MRLLFAAITACLVVSRVCPAQNLTAERLFNRALAEQQRGDLPAAINDYEKILKLQPHLIPALANLAFAEMQTGRTEDGIANYRAALRLQPHNARLAVLTGNALIGTGRFAGAVKVLQPLEAANASNLDLVFELGEALIDCGRLPEGLTRLQRVARVRNDANAWMLVALTQIRMTNYKAAVSSAETAVRIDRTLPGALTLAGIAKADSGDVQGAEQNYREALALEPADFYANLWFGTLLLSEDNDPSAARTYFEKAVQLNPSSLSARFELAKAQAASHDDNDAIANLETIVARNGKLIEPHVQLAALYGRAKRRDDAARERQTVDRLNAEQAKAGPQSVSVLEPGLPTPTAAPSH